jgi:C1A family cysteine protease
VGATDKGFVSLAANETKIRDAVANIGPVATAIHASQVFMWYKGGIYNEVNCPTSVNHAVLIVGYGTEKGVNFWIVKNSWGAGWGESGYFRIVRGTNKCGIASYATYPVV